MSTELVYEYLEKNNIIIDEKVEHRALFTMEEAMELDASLDGDSCKNLFLKDKKNKKYYLVTVKSERRIDLKSLGEKLGVKRLSFASEKELWDHLMVERGSVSSLGLINDRENLVDYYLDSEFKSSKKICFHPNINTTTLILKMENFEKYLNSLGRELRWIEL